VIAEERSLNWRLSAAENLRFFGTLCGLSPEQLRSRMAEVLKLVGLHDAGARMVGTFSSGMKQRLLIARALLPRPSVLLLDEPTRALDPLAARDFRNFLHNQIAGAQGCTILLATHDPEEGLELCDRVAVLDRGRCVAIGSPTDLMLRVDRGRYRVLTRRPHHPTLIGLGGCRDALSSNAPSEWASVEIEIPGGDAAAQEALRLLIEGGAEIARFEKVNPSLADVIERILETERDACSAN
ncbi:MAG: ATP-binding cassette domain-containing protein, partial [Longimicrobiales bacterium]